jgi:uncharacterized protein (DUF2062 family)
VRAPERPKRKRPRRRSSRGRSRVYRAARFQLVIPMLRSKRSPEYIARSTALGAVLAFSPTVGMQSILVAGIWAIADRVFKWHFSPVIAFAWTWIANPLTVLPIYYLLYVTGQMMRGRGDDLSGYADFVGLWDTLAAGNGGFFDDLALGAKIFLEDWGIAMVLGSVPWMLGSALLGYWLTLRFVRRHRVRRDTRKRHA